MKYEDIVKALEDENLIVDKKRCLKKINYLSCNSQDVKDATLFICKGFTFKEEYLNEAILNGACLYVSEVLYNVDIPYIIVKDIRKAMAIISKMYYSFSDNLFKIGVTGTKGKTTTVYFIRNIIDNYTKKKNAYASTIDYYTGKSFGKAHNTTAESMDLYRYMKEASESNLKYFLMEISSQAVKLNRIYGMKFNIGAFVNIGYDHIAPNEHATFEEYLNCKIDFLRKCDTVFLYREIDRYDYIVSKLKDKKIITFGFSKVCDYQIINVLKDGKHLNFSIKHNDEVKQYKLSISGTFNCINASCAIGICESLNIPYENIFNGLLNTKVEGRMTIYDNFKCPVIVDYAHNRISMEALFKSLKEEYPNKDLKIVVGCPGDKAFNRRKDVGELCSRYAKHVYLTAEDPGFKTVTDICSDIIKYIDNISYEVIIDREMAIIKAMNDATSDDVIAIIGKGDETYQAINNQYLFYKSDIKVVEDEIKNKVGV